jgi:hypothetical protein
MRSKRFGADCAAPFASLRLGCTAKDRRSAALRTSVGFVGDLVAAVFTGDQRHFSYEITRTSPHNQIHTF